jgi:hypothetical protein
MCFDDGCYWNYDDERLYFSQKEMKVGEEKNNKFVSDSESYIIDQYWLYSIYYTIGGGSSFENSNISRSLFIFPELCDREIRSENRDLKMEMNIPKEEAKTKNNQLLLSQKLSLSVIMEMLEKLASTQNETSPKSSRKRLCSDLSLPIDLTEGKSKEKGMFAI